LAARGRSRQNDQVLGGIAIAIVLLLFPIALFVGGTILAVVLGHFLTRDVEAEFEGTEYVKLA
jgi:hypothetical protein